MPDPYNSSIDSLYILQKHIRRCLSALLNGRVKISPRDPAYWLSKISISPGLWRYPVINEDVINACRILGFNEVDSLNNTRSIDDLFGLLTKITPQFKDTLDTLPGENKKICISTSLDRSITANSNNSRILFELFSLEKFALPGVSLCLHGSYADGTTTAFSDVDDLVVITHAAWENFVTFSTMAKNFTWLSRKFQDIDPYQHHGHIVITEFDFHNYDQSILPLCVLENGVCFSGASEFVFKDPEGFFGFKVNAENTLVSMQHTIDKAEKIGGLSAFELKGLAGEIMIIPAYLFQMKGTFYTKSKAIHLANQLFSEEGMKALEWATNLRNNFLPYVENRMIKTLKLITKASCARRFQAEKVYKEKSPFIQNEENVGLNKDNLKYITRYIKESKKNIQTDKS